MYLLGINSSCIPQFLWFFFLLFICFRDACHCACGSRLIYYFYNYLAFSLLCGSLMTIMCWPLSFFLSIKHACDQLIPLSCRSCRRVFLIFLMHNQIYSSSLSPCWIHLSCKNMEFLSIAYYRCDLKSFFISPSSCFRCSPSGKLVEWFDEYKCLIFLQNKVIHGEYAIKTHNFNVCLSFNLWEEWWSRAGSWNLEAMREFRVLVLFVSTIEEMYISRTGHTGTGCLSKLPYLHLLFL